MIACVSPLATVRSTPRRISLVPSLVSTLTCRLWISSVDIAQFSFGASTSTNTLSPSTVRGYTGTGSVAGRLRGFPVRRSKTLPCSQHSSVVLSTSPSDSETAPCEHTSLMACRSPLASRPTATSTVPRAPPGPQVEHLLVVEPPGRARVPGTDDLAGLDLEVRNRVGPGAVAQDQVAVDLVRVGPCLLYT